MTGVAQVAEAILLRFAAPASGVGAARLDSDVRVVERPRTTLYFLTVQETARSRSLVVKVKRYAHSPDAPVSDSPGERARREYEAMVQVHRHFAGLGETRLGAIQPLDFLPEMDAIVMDRLAGETLYRESMLPRCRLGAAGRRRGANLFRTTGRWLRGLHAIAPEGIAPFRTVGKQEAVAGIREEWRRLEQLGAPVERSRLEAAVTELEGDELETVVWLHSDFHVGNVHVVAGDGIVGVDTALNWRGNPYVDLGKFLADMKTRRVRVLTAGRFPSENATRELEDAFLSGYFGPGESPGWKSLHLFEGWFTLRKWRRTAASTVQPVRKLLVHPTYRRCVRDWTDRCIAWR